jgi:hypothetical protein
MRQQRFNVYKATESMLYPTFIRALKKINSFNICIYIKIKNLKYAILKIFL